MTLTVWRIVKRKYAATAFSGEGARLAGGRWNSPGLRMVYTTSVPALAILELAVHLEATAILSAYDIIPARVPADLILEIPTDQLAAGWNLVPATPATAAYGDQWLREARSVALGVPSAVSPMDKNYLLNPAHPQFAQIEIGQAGPCLIDPRLWK